MAKNSNSTIKVGDIVCVKMAWWDEVGIVIEENIWKPGGYLIAVPGKGTVKRSLDKCCNSTEEQRKLYFKDTLKYGRTHKNR